MYTLNKPLVSRSYIKQNPCLHPCKPIIPIRAPITRQIIKPCNVSPELMDGVNTSVYFIGKGLILFSIFYCSMNWIYYRGVRRDFEKYAEKKREEAKRRKQQQADKDRLFPKKMNDDNSDNLNKYN